MIAGDIPYASRGSGGRSLSGGVPAVTTEELRAESFRMALLLATIARRSWESRFIVPRFFADEASSGVSISRLSKGGFLGGIRGWRSCLG